MRLDKYLKVARLIKRRTVANDACDGDRVTVNGREAKASYQVKVGDVIGITFGNRSIRVKVLTVPEFANKEQAALLYQELPAEEGGLISYQKNIHYLLRLLRLKTYEKELSQNADSAAVLLLYPDTCASAVAWAIFVLVLSIVMRKLVCRLWLNEVSRQ